jgi:transposase-like protein
MSRRQFTKEFKEAAVRRLELGASLAEVARACEVNPVLVQREVESGRSLLASIQPFRRASLDDTPQCLNGAQGGARQKLQLVSTRNRVG